MCVQDLSARPLVRCRTFRFRFGCRSDDGFIQDRANPRPAVDDFLAPRCAVRRAEIANRRRVELLGGWEIDPYLKELDARPSLVARFPEPV
jgi:hypothetical protein